MPTTSDEILKEVRDYFNEMSEKGIPLLTLARQSFKLIPIRSTMEY